MLGDNPTSENNHSGAAAKPGPTKDENRVFDVNKPGKSQPDPSSRPLIVGHRSLLTQDPMVRSHPSSDNKEDTEVPSGSPPEKDQKGPIKSLFGRGKVEPLASSEVVPKPADSAAEEAPKKEQASDEQKAAPATYTDVPLGDNAKTEAHLDDNPLPAQKTAQMAEQAARARAEALDKLAQEKTYALPISQSNRKQSLRLIVIAVVAIAAIAIALMMFMRS